MSAISLLTSDNNRVTNVISKGVTKAISEEINRLAMDDQCDEETLEILKTIFDIPSIHKLSLDSALCSSVQHQLAVMDLENERLSPPEKSKKEEETKVSSKRSLTRSANKEKVKRELEQKQFLLKAAAMEKEKEEMRRKKALAKKAKKNGCKRE